MEKEIRDLYLDETWLEIRKSGKKINTLCTFFQTGSCAHSSENCKFVHLTRKHSLQHNGRACKNAESKCSSSCMFYHGVESKEKETTFPITTYAIPVTSKMSGDLPRFVQGQAPTILTPTIWQTPNGKIYNLMWVRDVSYDPKEESKDVVLKRDVEKNKS